MSIPADLANLPLAERLQAMEILWESLSRDPHYEPSPEWHKAELDTRIEEMERGEHSDWADAKERIRMRTNSSGE